MSTSEERVADVEFIFSECARLSSLAASGARAIPKKDVWHSIPHPGGWGGLLCGQAANQKILDLAEGAGRQFDLLGRVKLKTLRDAVAALLTERFLTEKRDINGREVDRLLSAAAKRGAATCLDKVHWIPCHLMTAKDPESITIGPITFRNRSSFRRILLEKIKEYRSDLEPGFEKFDRKLLAEAARYYRAFQWVAEIPVVRCDPKVSLEIAERAATSALDCLHLLLGAQWTDRMRMGGPALVWDRRSGLAVDADGKLSVSASTRGVGQINFADGWSDRLSQDYFKECLSLFGVALEAATNPDLKRPLSRRFLDAAQWFGEASRDERHATSAVKFITAIERMVMTQEKDDITRVVSRRVSAICCNNTGLSEKNSWNEKVLEAYDIRSKLVHGAVSPTDRQARTGARLGAELAEIVLLQTLGEWGETGLKADDVSSRRLASWFNGYCEWVEGRVAQQV